MSSPVTGVSTNAAANSAAGGNIKTVPAGGTPLTQQDFLKIMVAQFTQQDPLSSGSGGGSSSGTSDYVNQLMAMTNLTTMQTMSSQLATSTGQQALLLTQGFTGATVDVTDSVNGGIVHGVVTKSRIDSATNDIYLTIGGTEYNAASVISVDQPATATAGANIGATIPITTPQ